MLRVLTIHHGDEFFAHLLVDESENDSTFDQLEEATNCTDDPANWSVVSRQLMPSLNDVIEAIEDGPS